MAGKFMVTEVTIKRGERLLAEDGSWSWVGGEPKLVKRGIITQKMDNIDRTFLDALHKMIIDIMGQLFEDWKKSLKPKPRLVTNVSEGVRKAIEEGGA